MYTHNVKYYETDKMGITHHSNYIRWMEEARMDYLERLGFSMKKLEDDGIVSPVVSVYSRYKKPTTFSEDISVDVRITEFKGVKLKLSYIMKNSSGEVVNEASSEHCFINSEGRPLRLKKEFPEFYDALMDEYMKCSECAD